MRNVEAKECGAGIMTEQKFAGVDGGNLGCG